MDTDAGSRDGDKDRRLTSRNRLIAAQLGHLREFCRGTAWAEQLLYEVDMLTADLAEARAATRSVWKERDDALAAAFYAFVAGAKWWEQETTQATMWQLDQLRAEEEAKKRYPYAPHVLVRAQELRADHLAVLLSRARTGTQPDGSGCWCDPEELYNEGTSGHTALCREITAAIGPPAAGLSGG